VGRDSGVYKGDLGRRGTGKFFAMGLDSPNHTKSSPSGGEISYTTSFVIATANKISPIGQITGAGVSKSMRGEFQ
jgi:hypothetical protein